MHLHGLLEDDEFTIFAVLLKESDKGSEDSPSVGHIQIDLICKPTRFLGVDLENSMVAVVLRSRNVADEQ